MQMGIPNIKAQVSVSSWKREDVAPLFVMEPAWTHVDCVPHTVRHFHGLWAVGSLIGSTLDVDLVSLRSQGIVRVLIAMRDLTTLQKDMDEDNVPCLEVVASLKLNGYRLRFHRQPAQYIPDPGFRLFFWKEASDGDGPDGFGDDMANEQSSGVPQDGAMDVDAAPQAAGSTSTAAPVLQRAVTPYNHSPYTPRGKEIIAGV
jgi:hypothetical protein